MAKSFQFPFQKVLDLRKMIEESKAISLRESKVILEQEKNKLDYLHNRKNTIISKDNRNDLKQDMLSVNNLQISLDYITQLNDMISSQVLQVQQSNQMVNKNQSDLVEASKGKKVFEKLRERRLTDYIKDYRIGQMKKENEIATRVAVKNSIVGGNR